MTTIRLSPKLVKHESEGVEAYSHWCTACQECHTFYIQDQGPEKWSFNGNVDRPTFSPSMKLYRIGKKKDEERTLCHYILTDGVMNYCNDSPHAFAGKSVPLEDIPDHWGFGDGA